MLAALAAGTVLCVLAAPAAATTLVADGQPGPQPWQSWVSDARVPTVPGEVELQIAGCPDQGADVACTFPGQEVIYLPPGAGRRMLLHELGHRFDYSMPDWVRSRFLAIMGDGRAWRSPPDSPNEQFADAYSLCALSPRALPGSFSSAYGYNPGPVGHRRICRMISRVAARAPGAYDMPARRAGR